MDDDPIAKATSRRNGRWEIAVVALETQHAIREPGPADALLRELCLNGTESDARAADRQARGEIAEARANATAQVDNVQRRQLWRLVLDDIGDQVFHVVERLLTSPRSGPPHGSMDRSDVASLPQGGEGGRVAIVVALDLCRVESWHYRLVPGSAMSASLYIIDVDMGRDKTVALVSVDCDPLADPVWKVLKAAAVLADELDRSGESAAFAADASGQLRPVAGDSPEAVLAWLPGSGWESRLPDTDARLATIDLYLPICGATAARPIAVGHLGQSLDGFIATHSGDSQFVTGDANIVHLHRMRALCDAVVVGAGTVAADDPQLTTRQVSGPNPLRVVFDPARRLAPAYRVFTDNAAETLYVCGRSRVRPGESHVGSAVIVGVDDNEPGQDVSETLNLLRARGCSRVFVEGGGVTVSMFLEANLLDRLQIAIAPLLIGNGRPAIRLAPQALLRDCRRLQWRVFRMGEDILFDCELNAAGKVPEDAGAASPPAIRRI